MYLKLLLYNSMIMKRIQFEKAGSCLLCIQRVAVHYGISSSFTAKANDEWFASTHRGHECCGNFGLSIIYLNCPFSRVE